MGTTKFTQKWLAVAVALVLVFSMLPVAAYATDEPTDLDETKDSVTEQVETESEAGLESSDEPVDELAVESTDTEIAPLASTTGVSVDISQITAKDGAAFSGPIIVWQVLGTADELALYWDDGGNYERLWANGAEIDSVKLSNSDFHFEFYGSSLTLEGIIVDGTNYVAGGDATLDQEIKINFGTATEGLSLAGTSYYYSAFGLRNGAKVEVTINNTTTFTSLDGCAGINVPGADGYGAKACTLTLYGAKSGDTNPPTLTATGGAGAAGIGGNSGGSAGPGQNAGNISVRGGVNIIATGGDADESLMVAGGAGIGGGGGSSKITDSLPGGDGGTFNIAPSADDLTIKINAQGKGGGAGIGGGAGGQTAGGTGGSGATFADYSVTEATASNVTVKATSTGRGAGIGGGGGYVGGDAGASFVMQGSNLVAESAYGAGIGGGAGAEKGGDCKTLDFKNGTVSVLTGGYSSAIGGGAGGIAADGSYTLNGVDGSGGLITFYGNMMDSGGVNLPLYVTAKSSKGNDVGTATKADSSGDSITINGGSIAVSKVAKPPVNSTGTNVYPVVVPKIADDGKSTDLTADYRLTVADHNYYASTTNAVHGSFDYAAQLWLPEGSSGNIELKEGNSSTIVATGLVDTLAKLSPDFANKENVVSFSPPYFDLTIAPGKDIPAHATERVQAGTAYKLPAEDTIVSAYRLIWWEDENGKIYGKGGDYIMPYANTTLTGVWGPRNLAEVMGEGDYILKKVNGKKDIPITLNVEAAFAKEFSVCNSEGTDIGAKEGEDYTVVEGSTIITLKASWLSSLNAGNYTLNATYFDPSTNDPSPDVTYKIPFTKVGGSGLAKTSDTTLPYVVGIVAMLSLVTSTAVARRRVKNK